MDVSRIRALRGPNSGAAHRHRNIVTFQAERDITALV
jgi:hypothetical protein